MEAGWTIRDVFAAGQLMGQRFRVHDLHRGGAPAERDDLGLYLFRIHDRLHNAIHAETRVYTCRSWVKSSDQTTPYALHWNAEAVPGEKLLGEFGEVHFSVKSAALQRRYAPQPIVVVDERIVSPARSASSTPKIAEWRKRLAMLRASKG